MPVMDTVLLTLGIAHEQALFCDVRRFLNYFGLQAERLDVKKHADWDA